MPTAPCKETQNCPRAAQPGCLCPATAAGRESPGLKLASSSPPRQFHHSLWQTRPCGEVMTGSLSAPGQRGVRGRQHTAKSHFPIMVGPELKMGKWGKQEHPCVWDLTSGFASAFLLCRPLRGTPCPILNSRRTKERKANFLKAKDVAGFQFATTL